LRALVTRLARVLFEPFSREQRERQKRALSRIGESEDRVLQALRDAQRSSEARIKRQFRGLADRLERVERQQTETRLLMKRLDRVAADPGALRGEPLPPTLRGKKPTQDPERVVAAPLAAEVLTLHACPVCGEEQSTVVSEFNKFLLLDTAPDAAAARYDYSLCHRCGIVFARLRPVGDRFRTLVERFEETIGRTPSTPAHAVKAIGSRRLSPEHVAELTARVSSGVFVSEVPAPAAPYLPALLRDRLAVGAHIELLGSLLPLRSPRVLEVRPRFGAIGGALRRLYGAEVMTLPLFEPQQFLVRHVYGSQADHLLDYDQFSIPYPGSFDLIIANHLLTHAVHPRQVLATLRSRLAPGGHLYLYNEPDEADFLTGGKSMFNTLNPFHLQTFDAPSLVRGLRANGFASTFVAHHDGHIVVLATADGSAGGSVHLKVDTTYEGEARVDDDRIGEDERQRRLSAYERARTVAILSLPEPLRHHFASEWEAVVARAFVHGWTDVDRQGRMRLRGSSRTGPR
jgi:SAM-dependent methyltransferase